MHKVIDIQNTPNPNALKFILDSSILAIGVRQFEKIDQAQGDPLAIALFSLPGVTSVFYTGDFVTVEKSEEMKWSVLQPEIQKVIETKAAEISGVPEETPKSSYVPQNDNPELMKQINQVLDDNIRPALAGDGGGLDVLSLDHYVLTIHYQGACGTCPSATAGTLGAVQNLLQRMVDPRLTVISD